MDSIFRLRIELSFADAFTTVLQHVAMSLALRIHVSSSYKHSSKKHWSQIPTTEAIGLPNIELRLCTSPEHISNASMQVPRNRLTDAHLLSDSWEGLDPSIFSLGHREPVAEHLGGCVCGVAVLSFRVGCPPGGALLRRRCAYDGVRYIAGESRFAVGRSASW